jgi:hypothetical protein
MSILGDYIRSLNETMAGMFDSLPTDLRDMPHSEAEMAELSMYERYAQAEEYQRDGNDEKHGQRR